MKKMSLRKETIRALTVKELSGVGGGATTLVSFDAVCQPSYGPSGTHYECPTSRCKTL